MLSILLAQFKWHLHGISSVIKRVILKAKLEIGYSTPESRAGRGRQRTWESSDYYENWFNIKLKLTRALNK